MENAAHLLIGAADGLRVINEVEQLAAFEYAACQTSHGVRQLLFGLRPGMRECEAVGLLEWNGMPLSCHLMLSSGDRASLGLLSPSDRRIERGDRFTVAFGIWGALNCRAGFVVEDAAELPAEIGDYVERLVGPYFEAVADWYGALRIGQTGGVLHEIIHRHLGDPFFGIFLNPGHQIHLDEWVNSPVAPASTIELRSGMALQVDIIPATGTDYFTTNIEDGVALADETLRAAFAGTYPAAWERIQARRRFMDDALGIDAPPRRAAVLQHPGVAAAVPAPPGSGHDDGRIGGSLSDRRSVHARAARGPARASGSDPAMEVSRMTYEPKAEHRFSFGLWTVGNIGIDPFGRPVREVLSPVQLVELLAEVGAWGVNLHDNDLVPIDASAHERDQIVSDFKKALDATGIVVPMATTNLFARPGLPRRRLHGERPDGCAPSRSRRPCARSTWASSSARRRTCSGAGARASRPIPRRTRCVRSAGTRTP